MIRLNKFKRIVIIAITLVLVFTFLDMHGVNMFASIGGLGGESYRTIEAGYLNLI